MTTATDVVLVLGATIPVIGAVVTGAVLIIKELHQVHVMVNGQRTEMIAKIDRLEDQLREFGIAPRRRPHRKDQPDA